MGGHEAVAVPELDERTKEEMRPPCGINFWRGDVKVRKCQNPAKWIVTTTSKCGDRFNRFRCDGCLSHVLAGNAIRCSGCCQTHSVAVRSVVSL